MRRNRRWASEFQSGNAAVDAAHVLWYNTKNTLGNDLVGLVWHVALQSLCWTGTMPKWGRLMDLAPGLAIDGPVTVR